MFEKTRRLFFLKNLRDFWVSFVTLRLSSDRWEWTDDSKKRNITTFCSRLPEDEKGPIYVFITWQWRDTMILANQKEFISINMQSSTFILKTFFPATSILSYKSKHMAYDTAAYLNKPTCVNYMDIDFNQNRLGWFLWSRIDSNYSDPKLNVSIKRWQQRLPTPTEVHNGRNGLQSIDATTKSANCYAENFWREENLCPVQYITIYKHVNEQLNLAHKIVDVVDRAKKTNVWVCVWEYGQTKEFNFLNLFNCKEGGWQKMLRFCLCELYTCWVLSSTRGIELPLRWIHC